MSVENGLLPILTDDDQSDEEPNTIDARHQKFRCLLTVEPLLLASFLSLGLAGGVVVIMILERTCVITLGYSHEECRVLADGNNINSELEGIVQQKVTGLIMWKAIISDLLPAVGAFFISSWSDINGRKPVLVYSLTGAAFTYILYIIVAAVPGSNPSFILLPSIPFAIAGGFLNFASCTFSYITDVTKPEDRSFRMSLLEIVISIGAMIGTLLSPVILRFARHYCDGYSVIFIICTLLTLSALIQAVFFVRESLVIDKNKIRNDSSVFFHPVGMLRTCFKADKDVRSIILLSSAIYTLATFVMVGTLQVEFLFTRKHFGWTYDKYAIYCAVFLIHSIVETLIGAKIVMNIFNVTSIQIILSWAFFSIFKYFIIFSLPTNMGYLMYVVMFFGVFKGLEGPCLRSIVSSYVSAEDIGKVYGFINAMGAIGTVGGPPAYTLIYTTYIDSSPSLIYLINGIIYVAIFALTCILAIVLRRTNQAPVASLPNANGELPSS